MKLKQLHEFFIKQGIEKDPRGSANVQQILKETKKKYEKLDADEQGNPAKVSEETDRFFSRYDPKLVPKTLIEEFQQKLNHLMEEDKIFIDPEINIEKLSEKMGQSLHQTSYFINRYLKTNFYNLINSKRIELARHEMKQKGDKSEIEVIGYQVGFNSKSAFYRAFNKYVQQSPSDYIQSLK